MAENISQGCVDDSASNHDRTFYQDVNGSQNNQSNIILKSNSQLSINLDQVQINEQPGSAHLQKYPTVPGSRTCGKSASRKSPHTANANESDAQIMLNNCNASSSNIGLVTEDKINQSALNISQTQEAVAGASNAQANANGSSMHCTMPSFT